MGYKMRTATVVSPASSSIAFILIQDRLFWLTIAVLVVALAFIVLFPLRAAGDIALYTDIGGRVLDGQRPYIDFFDINPPTIHFLNVLPVAISRLTGLHPILTFHLFIWLVAAATSASIGSMLRRARRDGRLRSLPPWLIPMLLVIGSYAAWLLVSYGQRDHIFILALPVWGVLRWYRWEGGRPAAWTAVLVGILAAVGASLKPTFALGFVLVEVYGLLRYHRWQAFFTWEMLGVGLIVGLYGAYFVMQPDVLRTYLTEVGPSVVEGYRGYGYAAPVDLIFGQFPSIFVLSFAGILMLLGIKQRAPQGNLYTLMAILGIASMLSFALQTKGWRYHALPMMSMIFVIGGLLLDRALALPRLQIVLRRHRIFKAYPAMIVIICLLCGLILALAYIDGESTEEARLPFLLYSQPGDTVIVADIEVILIYPAVIQLDRKPVGRYPMAYPLAFAYANLDVLPDDVYTSDHVPTPLAQAYLDTLVEDVAEQLPQLILIRANVRDGVPTYVNVARYVKAHTDIESLLAREYEAHGIIAAYEVYVRKAG